MEFGESGAKESADYSFYYCKFDGNLLMVKLKSIKSIFSTIAPNSSWSHDKF